MKAQISIRFKYLSIYIDGDSNFVEIKVINKKEFKKLCKTCKADLLDSNFVVFIETN